MFRSVGFAHMCTEDVVGAHNGKIECAIFLLNNVQMTTVSQMHMLLIDATYQRKIPAAHKICDVHVCAPFLIHTAVPLPPLWIPPSDQTISFVECCELECSCTWYDAVAQVGLLTNKHLPRAPSILESHQFFSRSQNEIHPPLRIITKTRQ